MVNFNGRIGHIDVPVTGNYDINNGQRTNIIGADDSIFNFDNSENSLNVNNSKQYYEEREFERNQSPPKPRSDDSIFNEDNIFAKHFATTNNITEDEAKFVLEKMYGMTDNNMFNF